MKGTAAIDAHACPSPELNRPSSSADPPLPRADDVREGGDDQVE
jgi:hypothetical protein